ncbi:hypothetical protein WJX73_000986 [Symbiochloris irregularis]|uniref:Protein-S-isoprenylcysteine O-methyltransferase n=1 Tax=Symbiochloris irregularis TaxID=706552 RepID=A0AAW1NZ69_9CHLO
MGAVHLGLLLIFIGECIRKSAVITAGRNFSHQLTHGQRLDHVLVTHGIYRVVRHPSYLGWTIWVMGTQLVLQNPCCFILFGLLCRNFFKRRIAIEDAQLRQFFGAAYERYQRQVPAMG